MNKLFYKTLPLLLLLLLTAGMADGQTLRKFSVASFELDQLDLTARSGEHKKVDGNGSLYAIIKVTSNNPDDNLAEYSFNFGNMRHEMVDKNGELWVYVQRNAKMVTISRQGYSTIRKYDLKTTIEEGRTYLMQLSQSAAPIYTQMVQFTIEPATTKAVVMIKGINADAREELFGNADNTGNVAKSLPFGTYTYRVMAENYHTSEGRFTLSDKAKTHVENVKLRPNFSEVTLQVNSAADIYVNGEKKGLRSWKGILKAGSYQVECRQENHRNSSQVITIEENNNQIYDLIPPTPITGTLAVTSQPLGAKIRIDGKDYGVTPQNVNDLLIGRHTVTLNKDNYKSESKTIEIEENKTTNLNLSLSNINKMTIKSNPEGATLYIDGKQVGTTPYTLEIASGNYDIRLTYDGYKDYQQRTHLDSSRPIVNYRLSRDKQRSNNFYAQFFYQPVSFSGIGVSFGTFFNKFNFEASFVYGLNISDPVLWDLSNSQYVQCRYRPMYFNGKVGYSVYNNQNFLLSLQLGMGYLLVNNTGSASSSSNAFMGTFGARASYALLNGVALFATAEYQFPMTKENVMEEIVKQSSKVDKWTSAGINSQVGICVYF